MKLHSFAIVLMVLALFSCKRTDQQVRYTYNQKSYNTIMINPVGNTVKTRFNVPEDYTRQNYPSKSFQYYLQNFKLRPHGEKVHLYNGQLKSRQDVHAAILDISVGKRDLQQCADATMRLRAEYLFSQKRYEDIHFKFTNGFDAEYAQWRNGKRIRVQGNDVFWTVTGEHGDSRKNFNRYLTMVFSYAGTLSLEKEMQKIFPEHSEIGNVFIQGGSPGHAVIIVDQAKNSRGETVVLLAQSYMPAQEIHVLKNFKNPDISPWYRLDKLESLVTPEWIFTKNDLRAFP